LYVNPIARDRSLGLDQSDGERLQSQHREMNKTAILYALASAALFGASTPAAKMMLGSLHPILLAGLLYCGAGIGIAGVRRLIPSTTSPSGAPQGALTGSDAPWLAAAIASGGVLGPLLLMWGLGRTGAATAALLLALEGMATALIAWFVFHESFDRRILLGMLCLVAGVIVLSWSGTPTLDNAIGPLAVLGACVSWGFDNNLTRKVSLSDPLQIVELKGLVAGPFNVALALLAGAAIPASPILLLAAITGFFGYGVSLGLYVLALRQLGAARTSAYFSTAPLLGGVISIVVFGDTVTPALLIAGGLMGLGVWLHATEHHEHEHVHEPAVHTHPHIHDEHHQHEHHPGESPDEPHTHRHEHRPVRHVHPHTPDMHHDHQH
jgi:drug/metabolite transporter (DMT)-like permease